MAKFSGITFIKLNFILLCLQVNTYIIKNPPNLNPAAQGSSLTEGKRSKRSKKTGENGTSDCDTSTLSTGDQDSLARSTSQVAEEDDDTTWSTDVTEAAVRARMQDLTDGAKTMTYVFPP